MIQSPVAFDEAILNLVRHSLNAYRPGDNAAGFGHDQIGTVPQFWNVVIADC